MYTQGFLWQYLIHISAVPLFLHSNCFWLYVYFFTLLYTLEWKTCLFHVVFCVHIRFDYVWCTTCIKHFPNLNIHCIRSLLKSSKSMEIQNVNNVLQQYNTSLSCIYFPPRRHDTLFSVQRTFTWRWMFFFCLFA